MLVISSLQAKIKTLRIDNYEGEDISKLVSHVRSIIRRLKTLERKDDTGVITFPTVPTDLNETLMKLFQTSSDPKFNHILQIQQLNAYPQALQIGDRAYGDPDQILNLAQNVYQNFVGSKEGWTGEFHKVNESAFTLTTTDFKCFNCGGNHSLKRAQNHVTSKELMKIGRIPTNYVRRIKKKKRINFKAKTENLSNGRIHQREEKIMK